MKTNINLAALKKNIKKEVLNYYIAPETVFLWDSKGYFAFMVNHLLFESEILPNIPTKEQNELPRVIKNIFVADISEYNILTKTPFLMNTIIPAQLLKCYNEHYITPVSIDLYKMMNYPETFTIYQRKENTPILFVSDAITFLIMPIFNRGIKEKLQEIAN